jgi:superoxide dismutase
MPTLPHDFSEGVPGLLSADGFDMAWNQYMKHTLDKLNALTEGASPPRLHHANWHVPGAASTN